MKKVYLLILSVFLAAGCSSAAAGSSKEPENSEKESITEKDETAEPEPVSSETAEPEPEPEPLDLAGSWEQKEHDTDTFMAAYIEGSTIEVYWMMDSGASKYLYWAGTYEAPAENTDTYSWVSQNDKVKTDVALLASSADTKEFKYADECITFEVTVQGVTKDIAVIRSETDYSEGFVPSEVADSSEQMKVELADSGYTVLESGSYTVISYAVKMTNPNQNLAILFPKITVTARREDGTIISSEEQTLYSIAAGDTITYANEALYEGEKPDTVEISVSNGKDDYAYQNNSNAIPENAFVISNTSERKESFSTAFTGEITNNSEEDMDMIAVSVVFFDADNKMIGGCTSYTDDVEAGDTKVFEVSTYHDIEYDHYEIYGHAW